MAFKKLDKPEFILSLMFAMSSVLIFWLTLYQVETDRRHQKEILQNELKSAVKQIEFTLENRRTFIEAFSNENVEEFQRLLSDPENEDLIEEMRVRISRYVPNFHAYAVVGSDGTLVPEPFDSDIGEACELDIETYQAALKDGKTQPHSHAYKPYLHPQPFHYHFDTMTSWSDEEAGSNGVFFVSFLAEPLAEVLRIVSSSGHHLYIVRRDRPDIIEISEDGARDKLGENFRLSEEQLNSVIHETDISGTRWKMIAMLDQALITEDRTKVIFKSIFTFVCFLLFYLLGYGLLHRLRKNELAYVRDLETAKWAAEKADASKSTFLSSMTHELRTPLNSIIGFAQLLSNGKSVVLPEAEQGWVRQIHNAGNHLLALVNDILDYSRIEAGQLDINMQQVSVHRTIYESLPLLLEEAHQKDVTVHFLQQGEEDIQVLADFVRLRQVMLNLLSNAVKYNQQGGTVEVGCALEGNEVKVWVQDTGPGIDEDQQDGIFEAFNRLGAENSQIQGTGIGLSIVKTLVEGMNGRVGVDSVPEKGSCFWFYLKK